jgi:23S rRNA pseudouridine1911/1915/1917 synthase
MDPTIFKSTYFWVINKSPRKHFDEILNEDDSAHWEPLHRLDFETSGLFVLGLKSEAEKLRSIFRQNPQTQKIYLAGSSARLPHFIENEWTDGFTGERYRSSKKVRFALEKDALAGFRSVRPARQLARPLEANMAPSGFKGQLYEVQIHTGNRHQIRSFFSYFEASLIGDELYGGPPASQLELHSWKLSFVCPISGEAHAFEAPLPAND